MSTILLYTYLINLYIRPQDWIPMFYGWPVDYLVIIPALITGAFVKSNSNRNLVIIPQYKLLLTLSAIVFLSNAVNGYLTVGLNEFVYFLKKVCVFIIALLLIRSIKGLKNTLFFIIMLSSYIAIQALVQFTLGGMGLAGQDFYHSGEGLRTKWVGLWDGANITSLLLNIAVPFAMEFAFGPYPLMFRAVNLALTVALIGGVYTTNSRGGFVTLVAILFFYPLLRLKKKQIAIIFGAIFALIGLVYFAPSRMTQISTNEESAHIRTRLWGNAMDMFKKSPVLGIGKGRFTEDPENWRGMLAHSNFMQNLAEMGGIGIFVWIALIYFSIKGLLQTTKWKTLPGSKEERMKSLARALMISMFGFNVCTLFVTMNIDIFYLLLGLCAAGANVINQEVKPFAMKFTFKDTRNILLIILALLSFYHMYTG